MTMGIKPPPLPPRPPPTSLPHHEPFQPPPPPPPFRQTHLLPEKSELPQWRQSRLRRWYPVTKAGRRLFWTVVAFTVAIVGVLVTICAVSIPRKGEKATNAASSFGEGHPLSPEQGGVTVGEPGDIAKYGNRSIDFFVLRNNRSSFVTRMDPIVNPGAVSGHLHRVHGSSYFTENLIRASEAQKLANCSTTVTQKDLSSYWVPTVHYIYPNGSLVNIPVRFTSVYYFQKAPTGEKIHPFPDNYNIVVGNPNRRFYNATNPAEQALIWFCFRGGGNDLNTRGFPDSQCRDGLTSVIILLVAILCLAHTTVRLAGMVKKLKRTRPMWVSPGSHRGLKLVYPTDAPNGHFCPPNFPKKLATLQFETTFDTNLFPYTPGRTNWVLANGDTSGFGIHGDFMNGWDAATFQSVLDVCRYMNATDEHQAATDPRNCPALNASYSLDAALSCRSQTKIVNEAVGNQSPIPNLPGCNAIWSGNETKPTCPPGRQESSALDLVEPSVWYNNEGYVA